MKKKAMLTTSIREIWQSKTRFLSILGIIFLGVAFFVGIGATGPDMLQTANNYYKDYHLADTAVVSTLGLTEDDLAAIQDNELVDKVKPVVSQTLNLTEQNKVVNFVGYSPEADDINSYRLAEGRLPEKSGEIALDYVPDVQRAFKLGDTYSINQEDNKDGMLNTETYTIVGFVYSPEFIENISRGYTSVGKGSIDYFGVVLIDDIDSDVYSSILITYSNVKDLTGYSKAYDTQIEKNNQQLEQALTQRPAERLQEIKDEAMVEIDKAKKEVADGEQALQDAEEALTEAKQELTEGQAQVAASKQELTDQVAAAETELAVQEQTLVNSQAELNSQSQEVQAGYQQLAAAAGQIETARSGITQLTAKQQELLPVQEQLTAGVAAAQQLMDSMNQVLAAEDEAFPAAAAGAASAWQEGLNQLPGGAELAGAAAAIAANPTKDGVSSLATGVGQIQQGLIGQQAEVDSGLSEIQNQLATIQQQIAAYEASQQQLASAEAQLAEGQGQIDNGWLLLQEGRNQLESSRQSGETQIAEAEAQLNEGQKEYDEGLASFEKEKAENEPKLAEAKQEIADNEQELAEMAEPTYYYNDRSNNPGYSEYQENADRISSLATVFPIIFFLIAALVSLTSMTRMVEEKRNEIGTYKALGYRNSEIATKFMLYASSAGILGSLLGLALGFYLFPSIIFNAYGQLYNIDNFVTPWHVSYASIALVVSLVCTVGTALLVLRIDLLSNAASLLRPKAPKAGQRILLERLTPIWKRLSFIQKVTMRNLFRYKQRMLMTVLGIAGCMSMIITGFGLRDSILDITEIQFNKIWHYQASVTFKEDSTKEEKDAYTAALDTLDDYSAHLPVTSENLTYKPKNGGSLAVSVYVPEEPDKIDQFVLFNDRVTKETYELTDDGVIINEKLANLYDFKVGDTLTLQDNEQQQYKMTIAAIAENYTMHFAYMTPALYQKVFNKEPEYNSDLLLFRKKLSTAEEDKIANTLMEHAGIINVNFLSSNSDALDSTIGSLNIVVWVLIISAGLLAFIVLYNLTNINVSERIRELSTIKVLGFYDNEVTMYVYRENMILTLLGIVVGVFLGNWEHSYVLQTVEVDLIMFSPTIHTISYVYSSVITLVFTIIVGFVMYLKLKKVDMIEALKSNE